MSKRVIFEGAATALITPTNESGIDFASFKKFIEWQIAEGIDGLVVAATTGEGSTLSDAEHRAAISFAVETAAGRVPVIAGTGSNDTSYAIGLSRFACDEGCDGVLVVTPYYNKCTQAGLIKMYNMIADAITKPIIVYSVQSRTGVNVTPATCAELAKHENINAIKEASGNLSQIADIALAVGDNLNIYSGNDDQVVPIMSLGGKGVISVLANVAPKETSLMAHRYLEGDVKGSLELQLKYLPLIRALFSEVNPIPAKAACAAMGYCEDYVRMPLTSMTEANRNNMLDIMKGLGLI